MSLSEKVTEILDQYETWVLSENGDVGIGPQEAHQAIMKAVEEVVPEKLSRKEIHDHSKVSGWNACREEMLRRIKG